MVLAAVGAAPLARAAEDPADPATNVVSFYREIRPLLQAQCHGCHQPSKAKGGYVMTDFERLLKGGDSDEAAVVPKEPLRSRLVQLITPKEGEAEMPQKAAPLPLKDIELITRWIAQGAMDDTPAHALYNY
jgi:mono/diheme cytochrome c family protein